MKESISLMDQHDLLTVYLQEYSKLKDEQTQRIGFRDNIIYTNLIAVGGVVSFAVTNAGNLQAILIIPWICLILGWTYLVNDEKISAIGHYIRMKLDRQIGYCVKHTNSELLGWEIEHRSDGNRKERKLIQLFIDLLTFCFSGLAAIVVFWASNPVHSISWVVISCIECPLMVLLTFQMLKYADLRRGK